MPIGVLVGEMPRMLHDVVGAMIAAESDLHVVADGVEAGALMERVEREQPDVVVLWDRSESPRAACEELLARFPRLAVVALEDGGQGASIYVMRPMRVRIAEVTRIELLTAIRRAARHRAAFNESLRQRRSRGRDLIAGLTPDRGMGSARESEQERGAP